MRTYCNAFRICIEVKEKRQKYPVVQEQEDSIVLGNNFNVGENFVCLPQILINKERIFLDIFFYIYSLFLYL